MLRWLWTRYKRWRCRRAFNSLPPNIQLSIQAIGLDPESLIKRGEI